MSIFGPSDTRNYKKLANELYDTEIRFAKQFCEMLAFINSSNKNAVMDTARPYGALIYLYGAILANNILDEKGVSGEKSILIYYLAKVHKKPESVFRDIWGENPSEFRKSSLAEIEHALIGRTFSDNTGAKMFVQYFDQVDALVNKWSRDEF